MTAFAEAQSAATRCADPFGMRETYRQKKIDAGAMTSKGEVATGIIRQCEIVKVQFRAESYE
jgi:hypothetical protein